MAQLKDLIVNGPSRFIGDVYATTFTGNLAGNANTATSATNAGTVAGLSVHSGRNNEANKIVRTDGNGYLQVGYINSSSGHEKNASSPTYVWGSNSSDSYLRSYQTSSLSVNYATSSGSCSGNAATATKARYLQADNDAASPGGALLRSGSRRADTSPSGDTWIFWDELGGSSSYWGIRHNQANNSIGFCGAGSEVSNINLETGKITSKGFILTGSSSSYVLLGNGGHATISSLSVNYANSSGSCSGNAATATKASSAGDADRLDGYHKDDILRKHGVPTSVISLNDVVADGIDFISWAYAHSANVNNQPGGNGASSAASVVSFGTLYPFQIYSDYNDTSYLYYRSYYGGNGWKAWRQFAFIDSNVASASKWKNARTITLTGSVTGSVSIDGSQNVSLATTTNHTHTFASLTDKPTTISGYGITDGYTKTETDTKLSGYLSLEGGVLRANKSIGFRAYSAVSGGGGWALDCINFYDRAAAKRFGGLGYYGDNLNLNCIYLGTGKYSDVNLRIYGKGQSDLKWGNNPILHAGNFNSYAPKLDGTGASGTWGINISGNAATATNADTLDGFHESGFYRALKNEISGGDLALLEAGSYYNGSTVGEINPLPSKYTSLSVLGKSYYASQLCVNHNGSRAWLRGIINGTSITAYDWHELAFTDSNVASATKLQNSRTIWGQSFDGTGNVSGALSDVEVINFADNWMKIGIVRNSSNVKDLVIQSEGAYPISISSGGLKLRISERDLNWGNNTIYHSGNCNFPTTPWNCSKLYAENSVSTIKGEFRYIEFSKTNSYSNNGGYIDFHFNGSTADYTSRIIEGLSGQLTVTGKLRVGLKDTTSTDYAFYVDGDGYFVDNVITEGDFSSRGDAIIDGHAKVNSLKASNICIECDNSGNPVGHTSEINNYSRPLYIQYSTSNNCCICYGGGNVGIGITSPTYKLHVSGDARIDGTISCIKLSQTSDIKYKTNIKQIEYEEALKIIENLNPVTWDWNENTIATGSSSGFVAQEAEEFIPNAISRDNENNLSLDYTQLHSYEIKVIQEQQKEIIKLKEKLKILEKLIS